MPLRQLHPDPKSASGRAPPKIDIVAVHGLCPPTKGETRHAFDTWRTPSGQKGRLWLQQDLPDHIPDSRIFLYQYNTTAAYGQGLDDFRSKADNLLEVIGIERGDCPDRPVLLLGHSMGGLLIKQALVNAHTNPGYSAIKDATTGIVFLGTPHDPATGELGEVAAAIAKDLGHETEVPLVESLQAGSIFSELESWKHQVLQYDTVSFWGSSDTMVSRKSVSLGLPGDVAKIIELDASHRGLCKFGNTDKDQHNLKIVVENIKRLYDIAIEKSQSQGAWYPDASGFETPRTSEDYGQDDLVDGQTVTTTMSDTTRRPVYTPSQDSQLQADVTSVQNSLTRTYGHPAPEEAASLAGSVVDDLHIADTEVIEPETQGNLYSRTPVTGLSLPEPILRSLLSLHYTWPTKLQEELISVFTSHPPRIVAVEYPPGAGRTTALVIALLLRIDYSSTNVPQVLVIVPNLLLVHQMESRIKDIGMQCDGLVVKAIPSKFEKDEKFEANVIIATPGRLYSYIHRRRVTMSGVQLLVVDDVDYVQHFQGLGDQCVRVAARLPKTAQFLFSSDSSGEASKFLSNFVHGDKLELKAEELNINNIVHVFFRCKTENQKLDVICNLPGVVQIGMLIIFVKTTSSAHEIKRIMAREGHVVANLFEGGETEDMKVPLKKFKSGEAKVLITNDFKTRGLDLPSSSMVINYDIPGADTYQYIRQVSRAGKAGRFGLAVNLVNGEKELDDLQSVAASRCFGLHELDSNDWEEVEQFMRTCTRSQRF
ncbi:hypothetical protein FGADI_11415 [Fusarium gaditjirri]|uniref:ATP-dependent RNA helicase n=1 Tax=Fusarium gaditjirri TaxID=282569 RepID=A0A8H4SV78_9HYPO|nr:hypothetical protein FGADI_11415 [Fusarium gaditjirri]